MQPEQLPDDEPVVPGRKLPHTSFKDYEEATAWLTACE
jgi:hypothetical protein